MFDNVCKSKVIQNYTKLTTRYVPKQLIARDEQLIALQELFVSIVKYGNKPQNIFVYGDPGQGKTAAMRSIINDMNTAIRLNIISNYQPILIDHHNTTPIGILYQILKDLDPSTQMPSRGYSASAYYDAIFAQINKRNVNPIIIFDDISHLKDPSVIHILSNAQERMSIKSDLNITIIGITWDNGWFSSLDDKIVASWAPKVIRFPNYTYEQIIQILEERKDAFYPNVLEDDVIPTIAAIVAQEGGDIRKAIGLLQACGEYADLHNPEKVTTAGISVACQGRTADTISKTISSLKRSHRFVLAGIVKSSIIHGQNEIKMKDLLDTYQKFCRRQSLRPVSQSRLSTIITDLHHMGIVTATYPSNPMWGRSRIIKLNIEPKDVIKTLANSDTKCDYSRALNKDQY